LRQDSASAAATPVASLTLAATRVAILGTNIWVSVPLQDLVPLRRPLRRAEVDILAKTNISATLKILSPA